MEVLIGRLHPLLVHLPIGFILLAFLMETYSLFRKQANIRPRLIAAMYLAGFLVCLLAVITGLLLASSGKYAPDQLNTHKLLGIAVIIVTLGVGLTKWHGRLLKPKMSFALSSILVIGLAATGHFGGVLTHGEHYLVERAPGWVQGLTGYAPDHHALPANHPDSVLIYPHILRPLLDAHCVQCHRPGHSAGGFDATTYAGLFRESESGTPIVAGNAANSELLQRVTLVPSNHKYMPPDRKPLSFTDIHILQHWIEHGADSAASFNREGLTPELTRLLIRDYALDYSPRPHYTTAVVDSLSQEQFDDLAEMGFKANYLGEGNFLLDVQFTHDTMPAEAFNSLLKVQDHIAFFDLSNTHLDLPALNAISGFTNLAKVDFHGSNVSDEVLARIGELQYLEVLNVYSTPITETGLRRAMGSPSVRRVYVWQTAMSAQQVAQLQRDFPDVDFVQGLTLQPVDSTEQVLNFSE